MVYMERYRYKHRYKHRYNHRYKYRYMYMYMYTQRMCVYAYNRSGNSKDHRARRLEKGARQEARGGEEEDQDEQDE